MNVVNSKNARLAVTPDHPIMEENGFAPMGQDDLENLHSRFSEIDTETHSPESSKISYLEQVLRLRERPNLSEQQQIGRRFILDMLNSLCLLAEKQQVQGNIDVAPTHWEATHEFKYLIYLLERATMADLAEKVRASQGISSLENTDILSLRAWMRKHGLDAYELGLIQPNFFMQKGTVQADLQSIAIHPQFALLSKASKKNDHDYLTQAFLGLSQPLRPNNEAVEEAPKNGFEAAVATIFEAPTVPVSAKTTRLKAVLIPNGNGEPLVALSYVSE